MGLGAALALFALLWAATPAAAADGDALCLGCHAQQGLTKKLTSGETLELHVDGAAFERSMHAPLGCAGCHAAVDPKTHPAKPTQHASAREYTRAAVQACRACHAQVFEAYAKSTHAKSASGAGPLCANCHSPHAVTQTSTSPQLREGCLGCHAGAPEAHDKWLPNARHHLEVISCGACHAAATQKKIDLRLYDASDREISGKEPPKAAAPIDEKQLWQFVRGAAREGKVTLVGRLEVANGAEAHALQKEGAIKDCTTCHRKGAEAFQNVTVSLVGADGRRVRYEAQKDVLRAPTSVDSVRGFYAVGGTRVEALDLLLALALLGGISAPLGHFVMRQLARRKGKDANHG